MKLIKYFLSLIIFTGCTSNNKICYLLDPITPGPKPICFSYYRGDDSFIGRDCIIGEETADRFVMKEGAVYKVSCPK